MPTRRGISRWSVVAILALALVGGAVAFTVRAIHGAVQAEFTLHSVIAVLDAFEAFVVTHNRCPESWEDLRPHLAEGFILRRMGDADVRSRVAVRWGLSLDEALRDPNVVSPISVHYPVEHHVRAMQDSLATKLGLR
jgi:hypothetical protein